ncbi:hypothetical protein F4806DRAFT_464291 [Annulohypoxylon nitens]|nr:hypothetical protein F4806DRAFT_464291 [Annulohypoxylon nitens]
MTTNDGYKPASQGSSIANAASNENIDPGVYHHNTSSQQATAALRRHHVFRFWRWEIASLIVAFGLIVATYSVLSHYNGHRLPEWPFSINLNTLIALISTFIRATMLVCVAEVISQTKWHWFSQPRPLSHIQYFDQASRSISGSLTLLFVAPGSLLGVLGALLTILSLGIGPFTQQATRTVPCLETHKELKASIPFSHFMPGKNAYIKIGFVNEMEAQADMKGTMINGIVNPTGNDSAIVPTCATGNCTFTPHGGVTHSSIGMCSSCIDVTSFILQNITSQAGGWTSIKDILPNGLWLNPGADTSQKDVLSATVGSLDWASRAFDSEFASIIDSSVINVTVMSVTNVTCSNETSKFGCPKFDDGAHTPVNLVGASCALYPCLKNYNATVEKGILGEKVVSTHPAPINHVEANMIPYNFRDYNNYTANYTALRIPCLVNNKWYDLSNISDVPKTKEMSFTSIDIDGKNHSVPNECLYKMSYPYALSLEVFAKDILFKGGCALRTLLDKTVDCGEHWWLTNLYNNGAASSETLRTAFEEFTTAITNKMRTTGSSNYDSTAHEKVEGLVVETTICTQFQWEWLLMPTFLVIATGALMMAILMQNLHDPRQPVWKSSLLPLLYYGFDQRARSEEPNGAVMDLTKLNKAAANTKIELWNGTEAGLSEVDPKIDEFIRGKGKDIEMDSFVDRK